MENKSVVYVNFAPQENTGNILTYLRKRFSRVASICFDFHRLGDIRRSSRLAIYENGVQKQAIALPSLAIPQTLVFWLLPVRSMLIMVQLVWWVRKLNLAWGRVDYFFTVNAFTTWVGMTLKRSDWVKKVVFWVWDYYPPLHESWLVSSMRKIYWAFDRAASGADKIIFLNYRLWELRKQMGVIDPHKTFSVVPIGTIMWGGKARQKAGWKLVFMGALKKSQGLDVWFEMGNELVKRFPKLTLEVIGSGPDEGYFHTQSKKTRLPTKFYGYMEDEQMHKTIADCDVGVATYMPEAGNVSYFGDPSKIKYYLSFGLPVITTGVFEFAREIKKEKAGVIIDYFKPGQLIEALDKIEKNYVFYSRNATKLGKCYDYNKIYEMFFKD